MIEPRGQRAAADDMVDHIAGHEIRIVALQARAAKGHRGLRHVHRHEFALGRLGGHHIGDRDQIGLGRQGAKRGIEQPAERGGVDIANHRDLQIAARQHALGVAAHIINGDLADAVERTARRAAIGMIAERQFQKLVVGVPARIGRLPAQRRGQLRAHPFDIGGLKARLGQRQPQQVERLVAVLGQHAQRAAEVIAGRAERQFDRAALHALMEAARVEIAGALIDQIGDQMADAGLVGRVLGGAAIKAEFHGDQRHGGVLHEPGFDAAGRHQPLHLGGGRGSTGAGGSQADADGEHQQHAQRTDHHSGDHERFSSRLPPLSLIR